jgi:integrase
MNTGAEQAIEIMSIDSEPRQELTLFAPVRPDKHPAAVYLARLSPGSRRTISASLDTVAGLLTSNRLNRHTIDWSAVRYQHTAAVRSIIAELYAPATANKILAALRGVLREAWRLGLMTAEEFHRAADVPSVRGTTPPRGRSLSRDELSGLFQSCAADATPAGKRDAALLAVLYGCGLRRSELVDLSLADYDSKTGAVQVRSGKGNKARTTYAPEGIRGALTAWLGVRGWSEGPLFCPINKAGKLALRPMTDQAVRKILRKRGMAAGVAPFSPHDLRRSMISDLLDAGADISTVQRLAGHANVSTTTRYDRRGEAAKRKAANLLSVPVTGDR